MPLLTIVLLVSKKSALRWLIHLGGPSLILLGLVDNSVIPLPGSTDIVTILLAAHHREPWAYYAVMATVSPHRRLSYLPHGSERWQGNSGKEVLKKEDRQDLRDFFTLGLRGGCNPRLAPAAVSHRTHAL